jgi:Phage integrase, N-terminal SAM-like domain
MESKTKLLDQMRHVLRLKHLSIRTAKAYVPWAKRFMLFHHKRYPADMGAAPRATTDAWPALGTR